MSTIEKHINFQAMAIANKIIDAPNGEQEAIARTAFQRYWFICEKAGMEKKEITNLVSVISDRVETLLVQAASHPDSSIH